MPSGIFGADLSFPTFKGNESADQKIVKVQNYLFMLLEQLRYALNNLDTSNWNTAALQDFIDSLGERVVTNTVITQNLYAEYGDIAELTVDRLLSADKVQKYLDGDTSDVNYIEIQGQTVSFVTGSTDGSVTEQHTNRYGLPLYWTSASREGMTTAATAWPVTVYQYSEQIKAKISFEYDADSGYYVPKITLGAGSSTTDTLLGKGYIWKDTTGMMLRYTKTNGTNVDFHIGEDGITGLSTDSNDMKVGIQLARVTNADSVTITATETVLGAVGISVASVNDVPVYVSLTVTPEDATHAAVKVYLDGTLKLTRKFALFSTDEQSLCCTGILQSVEAGEHNVTFKAAADDADMTATAGGFLGYAIIPGAAYSTYSEGLVAYYALDDAADSGSLELNLTEYGTITHPAGKVGNCAYFNGTSWLYIQNAMLTGILGNYNAYTVALWFKTSSSEWQSIIACGQPNGGTDAFKIEINKRYYYGKITYRRETAGVQCAISSNGSSYANGAWHFVVASYDGEKLQLCIDNSDISTLTSAISALNPVSLRIGSTDNGTEGDPSAPSQGREEMIGYVDQVRFYNYALSAEEIAELWNGGTGK